MKKPLDPSSKEYRQRLAEALTLATITGERVRTERMEESLREFVRGAWDTLHPGTPYVHNWHLDCLCEHLQAMVRREIMRLIINICPRSYKSGLVSVMFPAWVWLHRPHEKFVSISYGRGLALRDSRKTRNLIMSPWYQQRWAAKYSLSKDQNEKGRFENDKGGVRLAASVEGGILGEGGSCISFDDPNDLEQMQYPDYRQSVKDFYSNSAASRFIDPKTDIRLCVQQRSSYGDDLTSYLMELGGWEQLVIPNEYDGNKRVSSIGWSDPRTHLGELMHPERLGPVEVDRLKIELRDNYPGQYQQSPVALGGGTLRREWFNFYNPLGSRRVNEIGELIPVRFTVGSKTVEKIPRDLPVAFEQLVASWDMAFKNAEHNDYVAGHVWARVGANVYLIARDHGHRNFPETLAAVRRLSAQFPVPEKLVEDKANGTAVMDVLRNEIPGLIAVEPSGGKWSRVSAISGYVEAGNVYLPNPDLFPWVWDLLAEFSDGRASKHDDDTDAMSQALKRLYDAAANQGLPEFRVQPRMGEPQTACHIGTDPIPVKWRRVIAIVPNAAALWLAESPAGAWRVLKEVGLEGVDAETAGRTIARESIAFVMERVAALHDTKAAIEMYLPKVAFAPVEPQGSWAELMEAGVLTYVPEEGDWNLRENAKAAIREAKFRSDMVEEEDSALDRLRQLLAFAPPDFEQIHYDRAQALKLARDVGPEAYADYIAAVHGEVRGDWPKLKIAAACKNLIAQMGAFRRDRIDEAPPFVRALLLGVSIPAMGKPPQVVEKAWPPKTGARQRPGRGSMMSKRFAMGR